MAGKSITARISLEGADEIKKQIDGVSDSFKKLKDDSANASADVKTDGLTKLGEAAQETGQKIQAALRDSAEKSTEALTKIGEGLGLEKLGDQAEKSAERILKPYDAAAADVKKSLETVGDAEPFKKVTESSGSAAKDMTEAFKQASNETGGVLKNLAESAKKALDSTGDTKAVSEKLSGPLKEAADKALAEITRISDGFKKLSQGGDLSKAGDAVKQFGRDATTALQQFNQTTGNVRGLNPEVTASLDRTRNSLVDLAQMAARAAPAFAGVADGAVVAANTFGRMGESGSGVVSTLAGIATRGIGLFAIFEGLRIAADAVISRLAELGRKAAEAINKVADSGRKVGETTQAMNSAARAAQGAGVPLDQFTNGLQRIDQALESLKNRKFTINGKEVSDSAVHFDRARDSVEKFGNSLRLIDGKTGVGRILPGIGLGQAADKLVADLKNIGVNLESLQRKGMTTGQIWLELIKALEKQPADKQRDFIRNSGIAGLEEALRTGSQKLGELQREFDQSFGNIGKDAEAAAARNRAAADESATAWGEFKRKLGEAFIGIDTSGLERSKRIAEDFAKSLDDLGKGNYGQAIKDALKGIAEFAVPDWLRDASSTFGDAISSVVSENIKRLQDAGQAIRDAIAQAKGGDNQAPGGNTLGRETGNQIADSLRAAQGEAQRLKQDTDAADEAARKLETDAKAIGPAFDGVVVPPAARESLDEVSRSIDAAREKLRGLTGQGGGAPPVLAETSDALDQTGAKIAKTDAALKDMGQGGAAAPAVTETNRALDEAQRKAQDTGQSIDRIGSGANVNTLTQGVQQLGAQLQNTSGQANSADGALAKVGETLSSAFSTSVEAVKSGLAALWREFGVGSAKAAEDARAGLAKAGEGDPLKPVADGADKTFAQITADASNTGKEVPKALASDSDPFSALLDKAKAAFAAILGQVKEVGTGLDGVGAAGAGADPFAALANKAESAFRLIQDGIRSVADTLAGLAGGDNGDPFAKIGGQATAAFDQVKAGAAEVAQAVKNAVSGQGATSDPFAPLSDGMGRVRAALGNLPGLAQTAFDGMARAADAAMATIEQRLAALSQAIQGALSGGGEAGGPGPSGAGAAAGGGAALAFAPLTQGVDEVIARLSQMRQAVSDALGAIPQAAQGAFDSLAQAAESAIATIEQRLSDLQQAIQSALSGSAQAAPAAAAAGGAGGGGEGAGAAAGAPAGGDASGLFAPLLQGVDASIQKLGELQQALGTVDFSGLANAAASAVQQVAQSLANLSFDQIGQSIAGLTQTASSAFAQLQQAVASAMDGIAQSVQSMVDAVNAQLDALEQRIQQVSADAAAAGSGGGGDSGLSGFASGGLIRGPGSGTSDSILSWVSNGEFVVRAAAVRRFGPAFFQALNGLQLPNLLKGFRMPKGTLSLGKSNLPRFADGGLVGAARSMASGLLPSSIPSLNVPAPVVNVNGGGGGGALAPVTLQIGGEQITGLLAPEDVVAKFSSAASKARMRSAGAKPGWMFGRK